MKTLLALLIIHSGAFGAEKPLPGYPFDAPANRSAYHCANAKQVVLPKELQSENAKALLYELCISKDFSEQGANILRQAFEKMIDRALKKEVFECTRAGVPDLKDKDKFLSDWIVRPVGVRPRDGYYLPAEVYVSALSSALETDRFTEAYPNYFDNPKYANDQSAWKRHLSIAMRSDLIGSTSVPYGNDVDFWSSMVAASWLKNMGMAEDLYAIRGNLIHEWMGCILSDGRRKK